MVDSLGAVAAAGDDGRAQRILQGAAVECRIDSGMRNHAGGTREVIVANAGRDCWDV
jgi:hypothetical protein